MFWTGGVAELSPPTQLRNSDTRIREPMKPRLFSFPRTSLDKTSV